MSRIQVRTTWFVTLAALVVVAAPGARAQDTRPDPKEVRAVLDKAVAYLKSAQGDDGSYVPKLGGPGVSAVVAAALLHARVSPDDPVLVKTLKYLEKNIKKDGGIYDKKLANYTTSVAVMALKEANTKGQYDKILKDATAFLKKTQNAEPESDSSDVAYGGYGYDENGPPDASNSNYAVEALLAAGLPKDDPAVQKALKFLSKCQNLPSEFNKQPFAAKASADDKGGFTYNPVVSDKNQYKTDDGGLKSLGSMTYGALKSFLYAGVSKDDPRVKAAVDWIRRHYTLESNPGKGKAGLFYYYHNFAKALEALGEEEFADATGGKHQWRKELFATLKKQQQANGSWINENNAFGEGAPELATAFAVLSLSYCLPAEKK